MAQKKETLILLLALLITIGAIVGLGWWLKNKFFAPSLESPTVINPSPVKPPETAATSFVSQGEKVLIPQTGNQAKLQAAQAIAKGDYAEAVRILETSLKTEPNDPEALIYLNNARIANNPAYMIAVVIPLGEQVNPGTEILRGVAQAQNQINSQGGIKGTPLKVIIVNDNNDEATARTVAETLAANQEVLGVVGHFSSNVSLAAAEIYQNQGLVMISPTSTSNSLAGKGSYIFRTVPSDQFTGTTLANYVLTRLKKTKVVVFYNSQSNYSLSLKEAFTTALFSNGGEVLTDFDLTAADFNAGEAVQQAKALGAEVLMLAANSQALNQALLVIQSNDQQLALIGGDSLYNPQILQVGGKDAVGMVVAVPWHILANAGSSFVQEANQLWKASVNWRTAMAYDATEALITAIAQNPTRQGVQQTLKQVSFQAPGAGGVIRFLPSGDRNQALELVQVAPGNLSGFGYDFVPLNTSQ